MYHDWNFVFCVLLVCSASMADDGTCKLCLKLPKNQMLEVC